MISATATEMQNNFGKYLNMIINGNEVVVTKNGKEVGHFIPKSSTVSYLTDSLTGILKKNCDLAPERDSSLRKKYEITD